MKPLNRKIYGTIPHLPASRLGPSDKQSPAGQVRIATEKRRDFFDEIFVQEKLDGSNVGVAKLRDGSLVPLTRKGYEAASSPYRQHQYWAVWVWENSERFDALLARGEWCVGEWCIQVHSTRYVFEKEPFFLFDIFRKEKRITYGELLTRNSGLKIPFETPKTYQAPDRMPVSIEQALQWMKDEPYGAHGAIDPIEGFVWRVERKGVVDFLCKFVRPDKVDGLYLPAYKNSLVKEPIYNYWADNSPAILHLRDERLLNDQRTSSNASDGHAHGKKFIRRR